MRFVRCAVGVVVGLGAGRVWWLSGGALVALMVTLVALYLAWKLLTLGPDAGDLRGEGQGDKVGKAPGAYCGSGIDGSGGFGFQ